MHTISVSTPAPAAPVLPVPTQQERFIRLPEVMHLCGLSRSTIYDLISRDAFPQQISLGEKMLPGYSRRSVHGWRRELQPANKETMRESGFAVSSLFLWLASWQPFQL